MLINKAYANVETITVKDTEAMPKAPETVEPNWLSSLIPMLLIFVVFYFFLIRPQEKKRKAQEQLIGGVKKGEEVLLNSGFIGTVTKINDSDNTVLLSIAKDVEVKVLKNSIADITSRSKNLPLPEENKKTDNKKLKK